MNTTNLIQIATTFILLGITVLIFRNFGHIAAFYQNVPNAKLAINLFVVSLLILFAFVAGKTEMFSNIKEMLYGGNTSDSVSENTNMSHSANDSIGQDNISKQEKGSEPSESERGPGDLAFGLLLFSVVCSVVAHFAGYPI